MDKSKSLPKKSNKKTYFYGLKGWNFYFLLKFGLLWYGYLHFNAFENLLFVAFLLLPLPWKKLSKLRYWVAIPIGIALLYQDSWLPSIDSIWQQREQITGFSSSYVYELIVRFINLKMLAAAFIALVIYLFSARWIRYSTFVVIAVIWFNLSGLIDYSIIVNSGSNNNNETEIAASNNVNTNIQPLQVHEPTDEKLNQWLEQFYRYEGQRKTQFVTSLPDDAQPFDVLMINICSLAWDDFNDTEIVNHPVWKRFDILFKNFNSVTTYSGPASIRLLRASCGQDSHQSLYEDADKQCLLLDNLANLGFEEYLIMDHKGDYGNYLDGLRNYAGLKAPLQSQNQLSHQITAFDSTPIYNDHEVLQQWLKTIQSSGNERTATFFNLIPLHDGNRVAQNGKIADYHTNLKTLLDQLDSFFDELEKSQRHVMVVVAPEHGAALKGDKMQISGLRDIPSSSITDVPVGIKFIGLKSSGPKEEIVLTQPSSYLAISELVARAVDGKIFTDAEVNWSAYTADLPVTAKVAENANYVVIDYQGKSYVRMNNKWVAYPSNK
ncbi:TPA: cellulose biosynthesis protein BcsG [Providencia rettgeri]|nr:cellulose biosynthesis protein BcsG [Providencia rettgeri]